MWEWYLAFGVIDGQVSDSGKMVTYIWYVDQGFGQ